MRLGKGKKPRPPGQDRLQSSAVRGATTGWLVEVVGLLAASEHLCRAEHEEVSEALRIKIAMRQVRNLLRDNDLTEYEDLTAEPPAIDEEYVDEGAAMEVEDEFQGGRQAHDERVVRAIEREEKFEEEARRSSRRQSWGMNVLVRSIWRPIVFRNVAGRSNSRRNFLGG